MRYAPGRVLVDVVNFMTAGAASAGSRWLLRCR